MRLRVKQYSHYQPRCFAVFSFLVDYWIFVVGDFFSSLLQFWLVFKNYFILCVFQLLKIISFLYLQYLFFLIYESRLCLMFVCVKIFSNAYYSAHVYFMFWYRHMAINSTPVYMAWDTNLRLYVFGVLLFCLTKCKIFHIKLLIILFFMFSNRWTVFIIAM